MGEAAVTILKLPLTPAKGTEHQKNSLRKF